MRVRVLVVGLVAACAGRPAAETVPPAVTPSAAVAHDGPVDAATGTDHRTGPAVTTPPEVTGVPSDADGPPADPKLVPAGTGWFCTASANSHDYQPCFRTARACDGQVAKDAAVFAPCKPAATAYCYTKVSGSGYGAPIKGTNARKVVGWEPQVECSATAAACARFTRARSVAHLREDGLRSLHKDISRCTALD